MKSYFIYRGYSSQFKNVKTLGNLKKTLDVGFF
jgi:hypothetical protein